MLDKLLDTVIAVFLILCGLVSVLNGSDLFYIVGALGIGFIGAGVYIYRRTWYR